MSIDYTDCYKDAPTESFGPVPTDNIFSQFKNKSDLTIQWLRQPVNVTFDGQSQSTQNCSIQFEIPEDMGPPVLFYYQLTNFYQNHRRYVSSFYSDQLAGKSFDAASVQDSECTPLETDDDNNPYYPCGLIANSLFNDTFSNLTTVGSSGANYTMTEKGIAWSSDKDLYKEISSEVDITTIRPPPNWAARYPNNYTEDNPPPDIANDEHFMVWMRTAALPSFSKLYMRNDSTTLTQGTYQVDITHCKFARSWSYSGLATNSSTQGSLQMCTKVPSLSSSALEPLWVAAIHSWVSRMSSLGEYAYFWACYSRSLTCSSQGRPTAKTPVKCGVRY